MRRFELVGLEMHSRSMWYHAHVRRALEFMEKNGFNALIFHQSDILNRLVYPSKYLSSRMMWEKFCGLRAFEIENNRLYLNNVIEEAAHRGIEVYLNLKEIFYTDEIVELFPSLIRQKGVVCPSDPFWWEYIEACIEDLCRTLPGMKGVILSCGTHEARSSITKRNPCECQRCRALKPVDWYRDCFEAVSAPLRRHGKRFIVRDFSFTAAGQSELLTAAAQADPQTVVSLKNTPHDYYPTFPHNPKIGATGQEEWVEFDAWGQFYGGGIFPASMAEDYRYRLENCYAKGVKGVYFRTDWEGMYENSSFSSPNCVNLYAAGLLANNLDADLDDAYRAWGQAGWVETFSCDSDNAEPIPPAAPDGWKKMRDFVKASWEVMRATVYVRGHWFCEDNMFPDSLDKAFKMMVTVHGRDDWEPGASQRVKATPENIQIIFAEKEQALERCRQLRDILQPETLGLPPRALADIEEMLRLYEAYCRIAQHSCRVVFLTQYALDCGLTPAETQQAQRAVQALRAYREEVVAMLQGRARFYPHILFWLLNERRMAQLAEDAASLLDGTQKQVFSAFRRG